MEPGLIDRIYQVLRISVAFFNAWILGWLCLSLFFNSERLHHRVVIMATSLLAGSLFFVSHALVFGRRTDGDWAVATVLWYAGLGVVYLLPIAWYVLVLFFVARTERPLPARFRVRFWLAVLLFVGTGAMLAYAGDLPSFEQVLYSDETFQRNHFAFSVLLTVYATYIVACSLFALLGLRGELQSPRTFQEFARVQARPSLLKAARVILVMSLFVAVLLLWFVHRREVAPSEVYQADLQLLVRMDLPIALAIAIGVYHIGRATIVYEIFTGSLPRDSIVRQWRLALVFASVAGLLLALASSLVADSLHTAPIIGLVSVFFYALLGRRLLRDERINLGRLRPFIGSQNLYRSVVSSDSPGAEGEALFWSLCADVLQARLAFLIPLGTSQPLVDQILSYGDANRSVSRDEFQLHYFDTAASSPGNLFVPLQAEANGGAILGLPLRSHTELVGALFLGEKLGGDVYTREEVETAQAAGERIIDTLAAEELSRLLVSLQRDRITESSLLDRQARRVLHDDVLPDLHALMLQMSADSPGAQSVLQRLSGIHNRISNLLREAPIGASPEIRRLGLLEALRQVAHSDPTVEFDQVVWEEDPILETRLSLLPDSLAEVLYYATREAVRNASAHARRPGTSLRVRIGLKWNDGLQIEVEDNGPGFVEEGTPPKKSGRGLSLHSAMMAVIGGSLRSESVPGVLTRVTLRLPWMAWQSRRSPTINASP